MKAVRKRNLIPIIKHASIDNSCSLDCEELIYDSGDDFTRNVLNDMDYLSINDLSKAYPELVFIMRYTDSRPKRHYLVKKRANGYMCADWRKA